VKWAPLLQFVDHPAPERFDRLRLPRGAVLRNCHAARVIHHDGDDVLLRLEFGHQDGRLPQQQQQQRRQRRLQQPDNAGLPFPQARRRLGKTRTNQPRQTHGGRDQKNRKDPLRPGAQKDKAAFGKHRPWILEKEFEHNGGTTRPGPSLEFILSASFHT
jgi:hypothetical protein